MEQYFPYGEPGLSRYLRKNDMHAAGWFPVACGGRRRYTGLGVLIPQGRNMRLFGFDLSFLFISAFVSFVATVGIVFMVDFMQPGLIESRAGTSVFVYIGVFTANLIIEAGRRRFEKNRPKR
jgi:hypothetical protein